MLHYVTLTLQCYTMLHFTLHYVTLSSPNVTLCYTSRYTMLHCQVQMLHFTLHCQVANVTLCYTLMLHYVTLMPLHTFFCQGGGAAFLDLEGAFLLCARVARAAAEGMGDVNQLFQADFTVHI